MSEFWLARDDERGNPGTVWKFNTKPVMRDCGKGIGWMASGVDGDGFPSGRCCEDVAAGHFNVTELPAPGEAKRYVVTTQCVETIKAEGK